MLITFSGLDGAGKTTLIDKLKTFLEKQDISVTVLTMYDHLSFYALIRAIREKIKKLMGIKSDKKNLAVRIFYGIAQSAMARRISLFLDLLILFIYRLYFERIKKDVLIIDRYLYDTLADVAELQSQRWLFIKLCLFLIPTPEIPIFVDVSPEEAFARKGEYPLDYMRWRRAIYKKIFDWMDNPIIVINDNLSIAQESLESNVLERMRKNVHRAHGCLRS